jgi:tricarballylate dehydrogenase
MVERAADVIVVGAGNAAFCAALAAQEQGASVLMLEAAPEDESGGNSRFTAGSVRVVYNGVDDIKALVPDLTEQEIATTDFGTYTKDQFFDDMARVTQNRADPNLVELLVTRSFDTFCWMRDKGVRFIPIYGRQAFKIEGKFKFWGGLTVEAVGGGPGLIKMLTDSATKRGIKIRYQTRALGLIYDGVRAWKASCAASRSCSPAVVSNRIRSGARAISGPAGISPRCAARASTPATASAWRWRSAPVPAATGRAAMRCSGK